MASARAGSRVPFRCGGGQRPLVGRALACIDKRLILILVGLLVGLWDNLVLIPAVAGSK